MKKVLFAAVFLCEISLGMNHRDTYRGITNQFEKYSRLHTKWRVEFSGYENYEKRGTPESAALEKERDEAKPQKFDPSVLDSVIQYDIGPDDVALQAFQLFSGCKLHELIDFYTQASTKMLPINAERFKETLLLIAPILNVKSRWEDTEIGFTSPETYQEYISKIIAIWGGNPGSITFKVIQYPQFCFEMFLRQVLQPGHLGSGILFQAARCVVGELLSSCDWNGKAGETALYSFSMGCYEDCGGKCALKDVWPNWRRDVI
jgi:hypothetical protein